MVDATTLILGIAAGVAAGLAISYFIFYPRRGRGKKVQVFQRDERGQLRKKSVTTEELERSRRDLRTIFLERDLLSGALTKVYEAENEGQITKDEREMIARRYSSQIRDLESKLRDKELIVEVGELEKLRDELVTLFREKIQNIESRLDQAKERLPGLAPEPKPEPTRGSRGSSGLSTVSSSSGSGSGASSSSSSSMAPLQQGEDLERAVERKSPRKEETEGERRVRAIRDEVMEALEKLEQIDTKKENESA